MFSYFNQTVENCSEAPCILSFPKQTLTEIFSRINKVYNYTYTGISAVIRICDYIRSFVSCPILKEEHVKYE